MGTVMATNITTIVAMAIFATVALNAITAIDCVGAFQTPPHYRACGVVGVPSRQYRLDRNDAIGRFSFRPFSAASLPPRRKQHLLAAAASSSESHHVNDSHLTSEFGRLDSKTWMFQNKYPIAYEVAMGNDVDIENDVDIVPILLLNGFGVGSFHQHSLMRQILMLEQSDDEQQQQQQQERKQRHVIYGIDYLGQGKSWPENCNDGNSEDELNLAYSADMWLDQLKGFIDEVILTLPSSSSNTPDKKKVHLVGNSVGGYLSTILTHRHPHCIASLTLMNATPVWGLNLPGWDGKLPAPPFPKWVGRQMFDLIRDLNVIDKYLEAAYVHREAFDGTCDDAFDRECRDDEEGTMTGNDNNNNGEPLGTKIRGCTMGMGGHAAFASILWSAPASDPTTGETTDFYGALGELPADVLLLFGSADSWCTPAVAKRMHATLADRRGGVDDDGGDGDGDGISPTERYVSVENAGHCPNHEAPAAVASVLLRWIGASRRSEVTLVSAERSRIKEQWGDAVLREVSIEESRNLGMVDRIISTMVG